MQRLPQFDDIPVIWASTPARELGTHTCGSHDAKKITHEETHSRNLIIPARPLRRNNPLLSAIHSSNPFPQG